MFSVADNPLVRTRLLPQLVRLAWPIAVSMLSYSLMTVVDTLFVGRLGAAALAGVAWAGVVAFTLLCFGIGLVRAVKVQVSQAVGAGRDLQAGEALTAGLALAALLGIIAVGLGYACLGLLRAGAASSAAGELATDYFVLRNLGAPAVLAGFALREGRYGVGDSRSPMHAAVVSNVVNIPLNAGLIFGLGLGVRGAALATLVAQVLELVLLFWSLRRSSVGLGQLRLGPCRDVVRVGWPLGIEFFLDVSAFSALAGVIARMGEVELASHQIALQLSHFAFLPAIAISEAASVLAGQAVGAREDRLVLQVAGRGLLLNVGYVGLCGVALLLGGDTLARCFSPDHHVQQTAARLLEVSAALTLLFSVYVIPRAVLRGVGSERFAAAVTVVVAWLFPVPAAYWLGLRLGWGAVGGWVGLCAEVTAGLVILWWRLGSNGWLAGAERARMRVLATHRVRGGIE
jgi:MATE family multidrug resistance protein